MKKNLYDKEQEYKLKFENIKANYYKQPVQIEEIVRPNDKIKNIKEVILQTNIQSSQNDNLIFNTKIYEYENRISIYKVKENRKKLRNIKRLIMN